MIERFDHRPMLTAALALSTAVLVVVVITLSTLLTTSAPPTATSSSEGGGGNPGAAAAPGDRMDAGGKSYGMPIKARDAQPAQADDSVERHHKPVSDYGDGWNNYGHDMDQPQPAQKGDSLAPNQGIPSAHYGF